MHGGVPDKSRQGRLCGEAGLSLIELLVATTMMLVTAAAAMAIVTLVIRQQPRISEHGHRVQEVRVGLERMTRDLRQTYAVNESSSSHVEVLTWLSATEGQPAVERRVLYQCNAGDCTRQEGPAGGSLGAAVTLITGVTNTDIFSYQPDQVNPSFLRIKLSFDVKENPTDPAGPKTLSDGVQLRNTSLQG